MSLKSEIIDGRLYTTREWIDEYVANKHSVHLHSFHNGRKTFTDDTYSLTEAANKLGMAKSTLKYHLDRGQIKAHRRGKYWIIKECDLLAYNAARKGEQIEQTA